MGTRRIAPRPHHFPDHVPGGKTTRSRVRSRRQGYVLKDSAATDIVNCLRAVAAGQHYTSPEITTYLVKRKRPPVSETDT
jgi:DNA-binding NarL/FixJ family response regulator